MGAVSGEIVIRKGETLEEMSIGAYWKYESGSANIKAELDRSLG